MEGGRPRRERFELITCVCMVGGCGRPALLPTSVFAVRVVLVERAGEEDCDDEDEDDEEDEHEVSNSFAFGPAEGFGSCDAGGGVGVDGAWYNEPVNATNG